MLAYMLRGLTLSRKGAEVSGRGSVKLSWISEVTGLSERGARYARMSLIQSGWLSKDEGSTQRKLNRHGAYFSIDLSWKSDRAKTPSFAPPPVQKAALFAPPIEDRKTPYGFKNQKTSETGLLKKGKPVHGTPSLKNVQVGDLFDLQRCESLYWQAVDAGRISHSESSALNFLAAAVRARKARDGDAVRIFIAILQKGLWNFITSEQEEVARMALSRIRELDERRYRVRTSDGIKLPSAA